MLTEKATIFIKLVDKKQRMEKEKQLLMSFQTRKSELQELLAGFLGVCHSLAVMRKKQIECPDLHDIVEPTKMLAQEKWQLFSKKPDWLLDKAEFLAFQKAVKGNTSTIYQLLLQTWRAYIESLTPPIQPETMSIFRKIPSFQMDVDLIGQHQNDLHAFFNRLPESDDEIEQVKKRCAALHELWKKFGQGSVSNEVLQFLKMAGSPTGAPMSMWTNEVATWLQEQDILNDCTIRI